MRRAPTRPIIVAQVAGVQLRRTCQSPSGANLIISLVTSLRVRRDRASECDMATATRCSLTSPVTKTVLSLNNEGASIVGASYLRKSKAWSGSARYLPSPAGRRRPMFPQPPISAPHLAFLRRLPRKIASPSTAALEANCGRSSLLRKCPAHLMAFRRSAVLEDVPV